MTPTKPSVAAVKRLNSWKFRAWSGIKHEIGEKYLGVPPSTDPTSWDMPQEWQDVIIKAKG